MKFDNVLGLIGNTPLVKLNKITEGIKANVYAKIEKNNLSGSVKDRASLEMIQKLIESGELKKGDTIIEPTSGNTGIALACLSCYYSLNCIIVMPSSMSLERRKLISNYNAKLVLVDGGMKECVEEANRLNKSIEGSRIIGQFDNPNNYRAHFKTAEEIYNDLNDVNVIIAGIGTGGTITGISKYMKQYHPNVEIIGVEPKQSPLLTLKKSGKHKIQGIGANFVPSILDQTVINKIMLIDDEEAIKTSRELTLKEGLFVGISSGAALKAALDLGKNKEYEGKNLVVILPDSGERYSWN